MNGLFRMLADITRRRRACPSTARCPRGELRRICLDNELASTALGWRPWTHLEDGLGETVAYLKGI